MYFITMHIPRVLSPVLIPVDVVRQVSVTAVPENGWLPTCAEENKQLCSTCTDYALIANTNFACT